MFVEAQDPTATLDGPRHVRRLGEVPRIRIDELHHVRPARFGRAVLDEDRRQRHEGGHLQKLALPVLEERLPRVAGLQIASHSDGRLTVLGLSGVVLVNPVRNCPARNNTNIAIMASVRARSRIQATVIALCRCRHWLAAREQ